MRRTKRLSIEFRHSEVTITLGGSTLHVQESGSDAGDTPTTCPACGSPWIAVAARVDGDVSTTSLGSIQGALQQFGLHLQISPAGQLRICKQSFEELKEKL